MSKLELRAVTRLADVPEAEWQAVAAGDDDHPFLSWAFLEALERSGCVSPRTAWWPCHLTIWSGTELLAAAPAYVKNDGTGDFSRDWGLADLARRLGGALYPKLVLGVPFSPVTGRRLLVRPGGDQDGLERLLLEMAKEVMRENKLAAFQALYHAPAEAAAFAAAGFAPRTMIQYHWRHQDYRSFDDWLAVLPHRKRKQVRRERALLGSQELAIRTVTAEELGERPQHWADLAFDLYGTTCDKYMWGGRYLNRPCFRLLFERLPRVVLLALAHAGERVVAGAFNLRSRSHLYGRYWGCHEDHRFLHFNVCLYHGIEECIARGIGTFEGGAGGEHKLLRDFTPTLVHCAQGFLDPRIDDFAGRALHADAEARERELLRWRESRTPGEG